MTPSDMRCCCPFSLFQLRQPASGTPRGATEYFKRAAGARNQDVSTRTRRAARSSSERRFGLVERDLDAEAVVVRVPMAQNLEPAVFTSLTGLRAGDEVPAAVHAGVPPSGDAR